MLREQLARRDFLKGAAGLGAAGLCGLGPSLPSPAAGLSDTPDPKPPYDGPHVVIIRFGGGVRRRETVDPENTWAPYFLRHLAPRGVLFPRMEISQLEGVETSHGQGTLYLMTGRYDRYTDVRDHPLGQRFEPKVPTLFEYLRSSFDVPQHRALILNGEDRTDEEFYSFSNHHLFGVEYRSSVLSLYRYKTYLLRRRLAGDGLPDAERQRLEHELERFEAVDHRLDPSERRQSPEIEAFWEGWRQHYGESGLVNPRGDRLLTALALRALDELRPKLMMIHYNDPDYVHWGNPAHYTRGISIIDEGIRQLVDWVEADEEYRDRTVFVVVPDCGRDDNRLLRVPFQHHFNSRASHDIFACLVGPGIPRGQIVDRTVDQTGIAPTVGRLMGIATPHSEGPVLEEVWS